MRMARIGYTGRIRKRKCGSFLNQKRDNGADTILHIFSKRVPPFPELVSILYVPHHTILYYLGLTCSVYLELGLLMNLRFSRLEYQASVVTVEIQKLFDHSCTGGFDIISDCYGRVISRNFAEGICD